MRCSDRPQLREACRRSVLEGEVRHLDLVPVVAEGGLGLHGGAVCGEDGTQLLQP